MLDFFQLTIVSIAFFSLLTFKDVQLLSLFDIEKIEFSNTISGVMFYES